MVSFPARFESAEEGGFVVTFPDFGYGITQGESEAEAMDMASDLLACLIGDRIEAGKELPEPGRYRGRKYRAVQPDALATVKTELYRAFLESGIRKSELAHRMGIPKANIDRLFNIRYSTQVAAPRRGRSGSRALRTGSGTTLLSNAQLDALGRDGGIERAPIWAITRATRVKLRWTARSPSMWAFMTSRLLMPELRGRPCVSSAVPCRQPPK